MLDAPMFAARWRWTATTSLALPRFRSGRKVAPQLQRMAAEDLLAVVFPDQVACAENVAAERELPEHRSSIRQCTTVCTKRWMWGIGRSPARPWRSARFGPFTAT